MYIFWIFFLETFLYFSQIWVIQLINKRKTFFYQKNISTFLSTPLFFGKWGWNFVIYKNHSLMIYLRTDSELQKNDISSIIFVSVIKIIKREYLSAVCRMTFMNDVQKKKISVGLKKKKSWMISADINVFVGQWHKIGIDIVVLWPARRIVRIIINRYSLSRVSCARHCFPFILLIQVFWKPQVPGIACIHIPPFNGCGLKKK